MLLKVLEPNLVVPHAEFRNVSPGTQAAAQMQSQMSWDELIHSWLTNVEVIDLKRSIVQMCDSEYGFMVLCKRYVSLLCIDVKLKSFELHQRVLKK